MIGKTRAGIRLAAIALISGPAAPASAHHSFAMFDKDRTRVLVGEVKSCNLVNPHGYLEVLVKAKSGHVQDWSVELQSALQMNREGIKPDTFKPGDAITVTINPLRDGTTGGAFVSAVLADGRTVGIKAED